MTPCTAAPVRIPLSVVPVTTRSTSVSTTVRRTRLCSARTRSAAPSIRLASADYIYEFDAPTDEVKVDLARSWHPASALPPVYLSSRYGGHNHVHVTGDFDGDARERDGRHGLRRRYRLTGVDRCRTSSSSRGRTPKPDALSRASGDLAISVRLRLRAGVTTNSN